MTITSNGWKSSKAKATLSNDGRIGREYNIQRLVIADTEYSDYQLGTLLQNNYGYVLGSHHDEDSRALLANFEVDRLPTIAPNCSWTVNLVYSTFAPPTNNNSDDPLQARVKRSWQTSEHTMYVYKDRLGNMIVNKANQPFDGGIPVTVELPTLVYERNEASFNGAWATAWSNSINQFTYSGAAPKTLKLKISAQETYEGDYHYWPVRYEMSYLPIGWQPLPLNAGLLQIKSSKLVPCLDKQLQPVTAPVPLDSAGKQIALASLPSGASFIEVDWFPQQSFQALGLSEFA